MVKKKKLETPRSSFYRVTFGFYPRNPSSLPHLWSSYLLRWNETLLTEIPTAKKCSIFGEKKKPRVLWFLYCWRQVFFMSREHCRGEENWTNRWDLKKVIWAMIMIWGRFGAFWWEGSRPFWWFHGQLLLFKSIVIKLGRPGRSTRDLIVGPVRVYQKTGQCNNSAKPGWPMTRMRPGVFFFQMWFFSCTLLFSYLFSWLLTLFKVHYINIRKVFNFFNVRFETL